MERRELLKTSSFFVGAGGILAYDFVAGTVQGEGSEEEPPASSDKSPPSQAAEPAAGDAPKQLGRAKTVDPEKTSVAIDDLEGVSIDDDRIKIDLTVGIENRNEIPIRDVSAFATASINSSDVASTTFSIESIEEDGYKGKHISFLVKFEDVTDSILASILSEEFVLGLSGSLTGEAFAERKEFSQSVTVTE